jgi:imidazolonepropionase-like amidohydrolase
MSAKLVIAPSQCSASAAGRPAYLGLVSIALAAAVSLPLAGQGRAAGPRAILIVGGTLIDGSGAAPRRNDAILLEDGRIRAIGASADRQAPKDAQRLDANGKWILPGFIDGHIHLFQSGGIDARPDQLPNPEGKPYTEVVESIRAQPEVYLRPYLCAGITSVVDVGGPMWEFDLRDKTENDPRWPRIGFTGPILMSGGNGPAALKIETGEAFWGLTDEATIRRQITELAARRPAVVKVVLGNATDEQVQRLRWVIAAAHGLKLRVAVHAQTFAPAVAAVEAGADTLVHSVQDRDIDDGFITAVVSRKVMVSPTLVVLRNYADVRSRKVEFEPFELTCAPPKTVQSFDILPSIPPNIGRQGEPADVVLRVQQRNLKRLADAGAIIYAGSDAGNTRTVHGPSLHRELALMVEAGLTPMQVLISATRNNAQLMGREKELGQIQPGMLADVLLLDADPLADIRNTRRIYRVIRGGTIYQP